MRQEGAEPVPKRDITLRGLHYPIDVVHTAELLTLNMQSREESSRVPHMKHDGKSQKAMLEMYSNSRRMAVEMQSSSLPEQPQQHHSLI